jgi:hypothetical protein
MRPAAGRFACCRSTGVLIDGLPLEAPAAPLNDLLRIGLEA